MDYKHYIREVPDFPQKGILFYDITTLLKEGSALQEMVDDLFNHYCEKGIQKIVAVESRGFIVGAPLSCRLRAGFVPVRKPGKLPAETIEAQYTLEYGSNTLAVHKDAISPGEKVLIVDDLLATGGTASATVELVRRLGGVIVGISFLIELVDLKGREKLEGINIHSLMNY